MTDQLQTDPSQMTSHEEPTGASPGQARSMKGSVFVAFIVMVLIAVVGVNLWAARRNNAEESRRRQDTLALQDTSRVTETWKPLPDGMELTVQAIDPNDQALVTKVQRTLSWRRGNYLRADYSDPRYGNVDLPGRADLEFGTANKALNVRYLTTPDGASLRWITTDEVMLDSLKEWAVSIAATPPSWVQAP